MTQHFDYQSSVSKWRVISTCGYQVVMTWKEDILEVASMVVIWWILAFVPRVTSTWSRYLRWGCKHMKQASEMRLQAHEAGIWDEAASTWSRHLRWGCKHMKQACDICIVPNYYNSRWHGIHDISIMMIKLDMFFSSNVNLWCCKSIWDKH